MKTDFYKLMLVTQLEQKPISEYLEFIKACISSGVTSVQLREKKADFQSKLNFALQLKELLSDYGIPLIVNDDINLAKRVEAAGVHLGQSDDSVELARKVLGEKAWIGLSIETEQELEQANALPVDYVAASAVFPSTNKSNLKTIWGIKGLKTLCEKTEHPLIGIGGINEDNLGDLMQAGAKGVAVIAALHQAQYPAETASKLRKIIEQRN